MKAIAALNEGGRQSMRLFKLTGLFYAMNLLTAAVLVAPLAVLMSRDLAHSLENARNFSNLDLAWMAEFFYNHRGVPAIDFAVLAGILGTLFLLLNTFLAGGAIAIFCREQDAFFSSCARYFPRLLRLLLISALFYGVVLALLGISNRAMSRASETSMEAHPWVIMNWFQLGVIAFLAGLVNMIFDYAKIACIQGEMRGGWRATIAGLRFVWRNPGRTLALYWICAGIGLALFIAYHGLSELTAQESMIRVVMVLALRQAYVLFRMWLRLWTWASEVHVYEVAIPPQPAPLIEEPLPPVEQPYVADSVAI